MCHIYIYTVQYTGLEQHAPRFLSLVPVYAARVQCPHSAQLRPLAPGSCTAPCRDKIAHVLYSKALDISRGNVTHQTELSRLQLQRSNFTTYCTIPIHSMELLSALPVTLPLTSHVLLLTGLSALCSDSSGLLGPW